MKPVKVLILIDRLGRGGVAQVAMNVAFSLNRDKFEPIICTTRDKPRNGQDVLLREAGIRLVELNRQTRAQLFSWKPLLELLPDVAVLHTHSSGSNFWGRLWGTLRRVPVIVTQEHTAVAEKPHLKQWLDRALAPLSDKIITVSEYDRQEYLRREKLPPDKVETVYVGIDTNRFSTALSQAEARRQIGCPADKWVVGVIARLAPQKNHKGFLQALALLPPDLRANMRCLLVGSGDLQAELAREARRLGLAEQISFLGERRDVPVILRALDLLALPSFWECLPSVISEAMAAGCPALATAVGGVPEMIGDIGWPLVPPGDAPALAEAMTAVWQMTPAERRQKTAAGRRRAQRLFSREASVARLERLYDELLRAKRPRTAQTLVKPEFDDAI